MNIQSLINHSSNEYTSPSHEYATYTRLTTNIKYILVVTAINDINLKPDKIPPFGRDSSEPLRQHNDERYITVLI